MWEHRVLSLLAVIYLFFQKLGFNQDICVGEKKKLPAGKGTLGVLLQDMDRSIKMNYFRFSLNKVLRTKN